jgi:ABC-2 type transport system ATP-binding protein
MPAETLAVVTHVSRSYGGHRAVHDISFEIRRGEVLGLLGPNGAGKTSTMRMLCGLLAPQSGRINVGGHDIIEAPRQAKAAIGYLPEQPPLYPDLTVDQYLEFCASLHRMARADRAPALEQSKARCGLQDVGRRLIGNLSRGYQQRVGIAQAILHNPALIILDEPTVGLDPAQIVAIRALVRELGTTHGVLVSTHILSEVRSVCDRVLIIGAGRLLLDQPLATLGENRDSGGFVLALRNPPAMQVLKALPGVTGVEQLDGQRFRITGREGAETAMEVADAAAEGGWGLFELVPATGALEETFLRLTSGDSLPLAAGPQP